MYLEVEGHHVCNKQFRKKKCIKTADADVVKYSISLSLKLYKNRKLNQYQCLSSILIKSKPLGAAGQNQFGNILHHQASF